MRESSALRYAEFCGDAAFSRYCRAGQVRLLAINETESVGPAMARYFASKLWQGEAHFMQIDAHTWFADEWDAQLVAMLRRAPSDKPVLSTYPPAPVREAVPPGAGPRMCASEFSKSPVEASIVRLGASQRYPTPGAAAGADAAPVPYAPFVAAGFFVAPARFLAEVPFDPFLPWVFMGEEISLSTRLWTHGWDIFAPPTNVVAHEYRPGRLGLPKFWETVARVFNRPGFNTPLMLLVIERVKSMVGYPESAPARLADPSVLAHLDDYGLGTQRPLADFLEMVNIDMASKKAGAAEWCEQGVTPPYYLSRS